MRRLSCYFPPVDALSLELVKKSAALGISRGTFLGSAIHLAWCARTTGCA